MAAAELRCRRPGPLEQVKGPVRARRKPQSGRICAREDGRRALGRAATRAYYKLKRHENTQTAGNRRASDADEPYVYRKKIT